MAPERSPVQPPAGLRTYAMSVAGSRLLNPGSLGGPVTEFIREGDGGEE